MAKKESKPKITITSDLKEVRNQGSKKSTSKGNQQSEKKGD